MVIFINDKGNAEIITPDQVYQGSNNVTDITVIAPFAANTFIEIGFILPDELYWTSDNPADGGARYVPMAFVEQNATTKANVWKYTLPHSVTDMPGKVQIAINAVTRINTSGNTMVEKSNCTSYLCEFTVQESVLPTLPSAPDPSVYELLTQYLAYLDGRTAVMPNLVAGIEKTAPNAFRAVTLGGAKGAEIVLENDVGEPLAPIGAASTVYLDNSVFNSATQVGTWIPVRNGSTITGYKTVIPAAMHAQMRGGAKPSELWLGFDTVDGTLLTGIYQGYTVDNNGDITITVQQPVAMNVRVWNGKGLNCNSIQNIEPNGQDAQGGNVYKITLTNGDTYYFTAPKGPQGVKGDKGDKGEKGDGATIEIGSVSTLPPGSNATVANVGTALNAVFDIGIPEGKGFTIDKTYSSIAAMNAGYATDNVPLYGFVIIDTGNVEDEDNAKLYIKGETAYEYLTDLSGAQGIKGETGAQGVGIASVTPNGQDSDGGNIYKITLTDGRTYNFTAPKGPQGDPPPIDSTLSDTSENPVQNKIVTQALSEKYVKPSSGIPESDLSQDVQDKLSGGGGTLYRHTINFIWDYGGTSLDLYASVISNEESYNSKTLSYLLNQVQFISLYCMPDQTSNYVPLYATNIEDKVQIYGVNKDTHTFFIHNPYFQINIRSKKVTPL